MQREGGKEGVISSEHSNCFDSMSKCNSIDSSISPSTSYWPITFIEFDGVDHIINIDLTNCLALVHVEWPQFNTIGAISAVFTEIYSQDITDMSGPSGGNMLRQLVGCEDDTLLFRSTVPSTIDRSDEDINDRGISDADIVKEDGNRHDNDSNEKVVKKNIRTSQFQFFSDTEQQFHSNDSEVPRVYDTILFNDELQLLELRLQFLENFVDKHIIVESERSFTGKIKSLHFNNNKHLFTKYLHRIIHVILPHMPFENEESMHLFEERRKLEVTEELKRGAFL